MGLFTNFARGFGGVTGNGQLDQLCREIGWGIDERNGDGIALYFKGDRVSSRRTVIVIHPNGDQLMSFICKCRAVFSDRTLPDELLPAILIRNDDLTIGGWVAKLDGGTISLSLRYTALSAGVDAASFSRICSLLIEEVAEVEANLHRNGLL